MKIDYCRRTVIDIVMPRKPEKKNKIILSKQITLGFWDSDWPLHPKQENLIRNL